MKYLKIGFFRPDEPLPVVVMDILKHFSATPKQADGSRTRSIGDVPIILRNTSIIGNGEAYLLDFARVSGVKRLNLSDSQGNESEITFDDSDLRPSDRAAAILDLPSRCLLIQENRSGITHGTVGKYLRLLASESPAIRFKLVMDGAAQARMLKSGGFTRLSIGLSRLGDVNDLASYGFSDREIMNFARGLDATNMTVSFGVNKSDQDATLNAERVIELASSLIELPKRYVRSLRVVPTETKEADEEALAIDMVNDRMVEKHQISEQEAEELPDAVRYRAVNTIWRKTRDLLRSRYAQQATE